MNKDEGNVLTEQKSSIPMRDNLKIDAELSRNVKITMQVLKGASYGEVAEELKKSRQRISQIVHRICYWSSPQFYLGLAKRAKRDAPSLDMLREHKDEVIANIRERTQTAKEERKIRASS